MRQLILTLTVTSLFLSSCCKDGNEVTLYWAETGCADPWGTNDNDTHTEIETAIIDYLDEENVPVHEVRFEEDPSLAEGCEACNCTTGTKIIVTVPCMKKGKLTNLGFKEN